MPMNFAPGQSKWAHILQHWPFNSSIQPPDILIPHTILIIMMVSDTIRNVTCMVVPNWPTLGHPFRLWAGIIETLQPTTTLSTQGVWHGRRANRKRAHQRRANQKRANQKRGYRTRANRKMATRMTCNGGTANPMSGISRMRRIRTWSMIRCGRKLVLGRRIIRWCRIVHGSANGRVRIEGLQLS